MKTALLIAASATGLTAALPAAAQSVRIQEAVARVAVIPEDRPDIAVEIEPGRAGLPAPRVERRGRDVRILGQLGRNAVRNCRTSGATGGRDASVEVRGIGRVSLSEAPLIVIRTPRDVKVAAGGATFGSVGRGARSVDLASGGCGGWEVADVSGPAEFSIGGSGAIRAGRSGRLVVAIEGSGSVQAGRTGELEVAIGGSGDVRVAAVDGDADVVIGGSGDVRIAGGRVGRLSASIAGSGDVISDVPVQELSASIAGSGDVRAPRVHGRVSQSRIGSGRVIVGR